mgnify:CR=1 FL=1
MYSYNIYNYTRDELIHFIDNTNITNYYEIRFRDQRNNDISALYYEALKKQLEWLRIAIVHDCIDFVGLSKLINYDDMGTFKPLLVNLFTTYSPLPHYKIQCTDVMRNSLENNLLPQQNREFINDLINFTKYRLDHMRFINNILISCAPNNVDSLELAINEYKKFVDASPYDFPYPFVDEELI